MNTRRVAILGGNRIPFARSNGAYAQASDQDMLTATLDGLVERFSLEGERLGEVVAGAVLKHARDRDLTREAVLGSKLAPETPGIDITMRGLLPSSYPPHVAFTDWTFTGVVPDLLELSAFLARRLGWCPSDDRRDRMTAHLARQAKRTGSGYRLDIPRRSAVLVWGQQ